MGTVKVDTVVSYVRDARDKKIWRPFRKGWETRWTVISVGLEVMGLWKRSRTIKRS
jgi:hypothetical protein